jgi:hypothetical protein
MVDSSSLLSGQWHVGPEEEGSTVTISTSAITISGSTIVTITTSSHSTSGMGVEVKGSLRRLQINLYVKKIVAAKIKNGICQNDKIEWISEHCIGA